MQRRFRFPELMIALMLIGAGLISACGGGEDKAASEQTGSSAAGAARSQLPQVTPPPMRQAGAVDHRIAELERQLAFLEQQSQSMRREMESRLSQIDETRRAMSVQLDELVKDLQSGAPEKETAAAPALPAPAAGEKAAPAKPSAAPPAPDEEGSSWFWRLVLLIVIVAAIVGIARKVFGRWGPEDEDEEFMPAAEEATDPGHINLSPRREAEDESRDADREDRGPEGGAPYPGEPEDPQKTP